MNINNVNPNPNANSNPILSVVCQIDWEERMIMRKLLQYGITPTGKKSVDKAKLHEIELREAQKENCITNKFLTVTKSEQERIQAKKKEKRKEINPELYPDTDKAMKKLGEQKYLAIQMNMKKKKSV